MKKLIGQIIWLAIFAMMVAATVYPKVSPVSQALIWILNGVICGIAPLGLLASLIIEDKDKLQKFAGKKKGVLKNAIAAIKITMMFSAVAYAGFTVAAIFYVLGAFFIWLSTWIANDRLEGM